MLAIFPQGKRYPGRNPSETPLLAGAGMLAVKTMCTVLPISIGTKRMRFRLFRRVYIHIGTPIEASELIGTSDGEQNDKPDYQLVTRRIYDEILRLGDFSILTED